MLLLFRYAIEADRHPVETESFIEQEPDLPPETRMAFLFVAQSIRRDTDRWRLKRQRYSEAAQRRREERSAFREEQKDAELAYYLNRFQEEQKAAQAEKRGSGAPGRER